MTARIFVRSHALGKWPMLFAAGALVASAACQKAPTLDDRMAEMEKQVPVVEVIRLHEPKAYQELRSIVEVAMKKGKIDDATVASVRAVATRIYDRKLPLASDENIMLSADVVGDELTALQANPQKCVELLAGTAGDIRPFLSEELRRRESVLLSRITQGPPSRQARQASDSEARDILGPLLEDLAEAYGEENVGAALQMQGEPDVICKVMGELIRALAALPQEKAVPVLRRIYAQSGQK